MTIVAERPANSLTATDWSPGPLPLRIEVLGSEHRATVMQEWSQFDEIIGNERTACSADWTDLWLKHYGTTVPHRFVVARRGETLCGLCLLTRGLDQRDGPFPVKTWHVGTSGEHDRDSVCVEYNALLCRIEDRDEFFRVLWNHLQGDPQWDEFHLDGFASDDLPALPAATGGWQTVRKVSRYFDLDRCRGERGEPINYLGYSTRKNIRQGLRAYGNPVLEWSETTVQAANIFEEMISLHQARWTSIGEPGCYASRLFSEFHRELLARLVPQQRMVLVRLRNGTSTLACSQYLVDGRRLLVYQGGRLPDETKRSPGLILDYLVIEEALRRGYSAYDYLAGDSRHKQRVTTDGAELMWCTYRRPRWKFLLMSQLRGCRQRLRRWSQSTAKATPAVVNPTVNDGS